jgi:hypothetical protein
MRALMKLSLLLVVAAAGVAGVQAQTNVSRQSPSWRAEERQERRADLMRCFELSASLFDDRISPANVVADAVAWHCEAQGIPENYWATCRCDGRSRIPRTSTIAISLCLSC